MVAQSFSPLAEYRPGVPGSRQSSGWEPPKPKKLFLRVPSRESGECADCVNLLEIFDGVTPVALYYSDRQEYDFKAVPGVMPAEGLLAKLREILGDNNVVLK